MDIRENVSLSNYSTMRLGGNARYLANVTDTNQLPEIIKWANEKKLPVIMIGEGSNIIWGDNGFTGLVLVNKIKGIKVDKLDDKSYFAVIGAGEDWDAVVEHCVKLGLSGIEQLSYIPGTAGATPVQNVGAYGREISDVFVSLDAFDLQLQKIITIDKDQCEFGYRTSRFKTTDRGRFFITSITLKLTKTNPEPPFYASVEQYLSDHNIDEYTPAIIRQAVIAVRTSKLPDPDIVANNGSFFANPIISTAKFEKLHKKFPDLVFWHLESGHVKLSAAWLIEHVGYKNYHDKETGMATWDKQALVLINEHAKSANDLLRFKQKIVDAVHNKFGITLEQEPEFIH